MAHCVLRNGQQRLRQIIGPIILVLGAKGPHATWPGESSDEAAEGQSITRESITSESLEPSGTLELTEKKEVPRPVMFLMSPG